MNTGENGSGENGDKYLFGIKNCSINDRPQLIALLQHTSGKNIICIEYYCSEENYINVRHVCHSIVSDRILAKLI